MLLLVSNPRRNCSLIEFGNALKKSGLYVLGHVHVDNLEEHDKDPTLNEIPHWLKLIDFLKVKAFVEVTIARSLRLGVDQLVRISGIGAMKPNTVLLGFKDDTFPRDDFKNLSSPYATSEFDNIFPLSDEKETLDTKEYVGIIVDIIKQTKNICLCRHFQKLNTSDMFSPKKESIFGTTAKAKTYLDVWLINFLSKEPTKTDITDSTSLLILQLACIVNMVNRWKRLKIRVFIAVDAKENSLQKTSRVSRPLGNVANRSHDKDFILGRPKNFYIDEDPSNREWSDIKDHLGICKETVRKRSEQTAVTFLYMPEVPKDEEKIY
ncbi:SLC12A9 [Lepeophtheirus salmonis]|uniref:SLC12A9 n=1 Tax=Lepeophtheirus salmonis TaxID=72036 RepID=A0A7R8D3J4_LEPSM|nr:SLC12A9 [Lepeophtheirus salmonis]CAF3014406.1 SLC12A9 [Lepeophtheirus salmonis]